MFSLDKKKTIAGRNVWKIDTKWLPLARKSVSTSKNKIVFQKLDFLVSIGRKKYLSKNGCQ